MYQNKGWKCLNWYPAQRVDLDVTYASGRTRGPMPVCFEEGDVDGSGGTDISDLTYLVEYMFYQGPPPVNCPL